MVEDFRRKAVWARENEARVESLIVIGELRGLGHGPKRTAVQLHNDHRCGMRLFCSHALEISWRRRFPDCARQLGNQDRGTRIIAILIVEPKAETNTVFGDVVAGASMLTTTEFIPISSSYEHTVARLLIDQRRVFEKPLRYDARDPVFPDFVLWDTAVGPRPMEVYGRDDAEYIRHREEKRRIYTALYGSGWCWEWEVDPARPHDIPEFPQKT